MAQLTAKLLGGPYDGLTARFYPDVTAPPEIVLLGLSAYQSVTDPDTRDWLGGYAYVGRHRGAS